MTYRNADTRIREAFAALRAEIEGVFGSEAPDQVRLLGGAPILASEFLDAMEQGLLDYAKQPASEG
jgi:hypothetical protein